MKSPAFRSLAALLAVLLAIDTAAAGRWLRSCSLFSRGAACCEPCVPACQPCVAAPSCEACVAPSCGEPAATATDCDCGGAPAVEAFEGETPAPAESEPTPALPVEVEEPAPASDAFGAGFRSGMPTDTERVEAPGDEWSTGVDPAPQEPEAAVEVEESAPEPAEPASAEPEVTEQAPAEELFAPPAEEPIAAEEPVTAEESQATPPVEEDLFEEAASEEPVTEEPAAEEPATEEPADGAFDDMFGEEPTADEAPTEQAPTEEAIEQAPAEQAPAEESSNEGDDLFGDEPFGGETVEETAPLAAEDPLAGETPVEDAAATGAESNVTEGQTANDLFGDDSAPVEEAAIEEQPAEEPADDLFGAEPAESKATTEEPATDDLFGAEEAEAPAETPADQSDDLFGDIDEEEEEEEVPPPAEAPAAEGEKSPEEGDESDDLFGGIGAVLREAGGVESSRDRTWIDNTGRFSTTARLLAVDADSVRLLKRDGSIASVSLARLSQGDLEFVSRQSIAQQELREGVLVRRPAGAAEPKQAQADPSAPLRTASL